MEDRYCKFRHWPREGALKQVDKVTSRTEMCMPGHVSLVPFLCSHTAEFLQGIYFLLQCCKKFNCKSYYMSLWLYQRLDVLVRLYLADSL